MNPSTWGPKNVGSPKRNFGKPLGKPTLGRAEGGRCFGQGPGDASKIEGFRGDDLGKLRGFLSVVGLVVGFVQFVSRFFFFRAHGMCYGWSQGERSASCEKNNSSWWQLKYVFKFSTRTSGKRFEPILRIYRIFFRWVGKNHQLVFCVSFFFYNVETKR